LNERRRQRHERARNECRHTRYRAQRTLTRAKPIAEASTVELIRRKWPRREKTAELTSARNASVDEHGSERSAEPHRVRGDRAASAGKPVVAVHIDGEL